MRTFCMYTMNYLNVKPSLFKVNFLASVIINKLQVCISQPDVKLIYKNT